MCSSDLRVLSFATCRQFLSEVARFSGTRTRFAASECDRRLRRLFRVQRQSSASPATRIFFGVALLKLLKFLDLKVSMAPMLNICGDNLPRNDLTYLAFRVAFQETLERIVLSRQVEDGNDVFGYLTEVPFLQGVAPHVQLDMLATSWDRHNSRKRHEATLIDESIVYAICETAARIAEEEPTVITHCMITGPRQCHVLVDSFLAGELRNLHLSLSNEGDFLLVSQFEDMAPDESWDLKMQFGLEDWRISELFDALGQWHVEPGMAERLTGLVTEREAARVNYVIDEVLRQSAPRSEG